jgi:hypothetical protein
MRLISHSRFVSAALLLACLASSAAFAQDITATIVGTITDASGSDVADAKVKIFSLDRQTEERSLKTNTAGSFAAAFLPIGKYNLVVEAPGFKKAIRENVILNVSDKLTLNVQLETGDLTQSVTVEAVSVPLQLQQGAEQSTTVTGTQIRELALVTRNYEQLVGMMPGVSAASVDQLYVGVSLPSGQTATIPFSINGARNSSSAWLVDGADNVDRGSNQTLLNTPSIDSIAEFKVQRSGYSAESGRAGGAQISVVTKSGTNEFHGNVFEFVRNNAFAANNFYNNATSLNLGSDGKANVASLRYNNFGGTLGGPIIIPKIYNGKNKTFFFFSEEIRRVITYASGTATLPTTGELNGIFPHAVCVSYTGNSCNQTSTSIANIDPVAKAYVKDIFSKLALNTTGNTVVSLFRNVFNFEQELYKIDHRFGDKLQVSARFLRDQIPTTEPQGLFTGSPVNGVPTTSTNAPGQNWVVRATSSFSPTLLNEAGFNYSYGAIISNPVGLINSTYSTDIKPLIALPFPATISQVPTLAFAGGGSSITGYGPYRDYNRNYNAYDNMTKILGNHSVRFGVTYNHYQKTENAGGANAGNFNFTPASTPAGATTYEQAFANFLLGNVATFSQTSLDITPDIRAQQWEIYAQDDWRIRPNLTLSFGLRYSMFRQPIDNNGQLSNFDPASYNPANAPLLTAAGLLANISAQSYLNGIITGGKGSPYGSKISTQDNLDLAPRFGFAWDPTRQGKMAIRGGYGIFFDPTLYGTFEQNIFQNPPVVNAVSIPNAGFANPAGGTATVSNSPKYIRATPTQFNTPYTQQWSLGVQRQFFKDAVVEATYVGTKGTHLIGIVDLNSVRPGLAYTSGLVPDSTVFTSANETMLNRLRPYQGYGSIGAVEPWFNSNYNALQVSARKNLGADALISISYTWSKSLTDNGSDRSNAPQDLYNFNSGEYGPATFDRTQVFNLNFVYTLPFYKTQQGFKGKALGGWQISGIASYYTGLPYTVTTANVDPAGLGIIGSSPASLRPDLVCDANSNAPQTRAQWFNTACFQNVPTGQHRVGNEGRGVIRGPGYEGWSFSGSKNLLFGAEQRFRFQLRGEASNAFNHTNPSTFGSLANTSALFGTVTGYRDPRIIQLGAKLYF